MDSSNLNSWRKATGRRQGIVKKHEGTSIASTYSIILSVVAILAMMLFVKK